jgi:hypothetical protein
VTKAASNIREYVNQEVMQEDFDDEESDNQDHEQLRGQWLQ